MGRCCGALAGGGASTEDPQPIDSAQLFVCDEANPPTAHHDNQPTVSIVNLLWRVSVSPFLAKP